MGYFQSSWKFREPVGVCKQTLLLRLSAAVSQTSYMCKRASADWLHFPIYGEDLFYFVDPYNESACFCVFPSCKISISGHTSLPRIKIFYITCHRLHSPAPRKTRNLRVSSNRSAKTAIKGACPCLSDGTVSSLVMIMSLCRLRGNITLGLYSLLL